VLLDQSSALTGVQDLEDLEPQVRPGFRLGCGTVAHLAYVTASGRPVALRQSFLELGVRTPISRKQLAPCFHAPDENLVHFRPLLIRQPQCRDELGLVPPGARDAS
jgi:hypothetical protein